MQSNISMKKLSRQLLPNNIFWGYDGLSMSGKNPLPDTELAICRRLRLYRQRCGLPRRLFARELAVDSSVIIRIELGRMPLRYGIASRATQVFSINPLWLATGDGTIIISIPLPSPEEISVDERELFSAVFSEKLSQSIKSKLAEIEASPAHKYGRNEHPTDPKGRLVAEEFLLSNLREWLINVRSARFNDLINAIRYAAMPFVDGWETKTDSLAVIEKRRAAIAVERAKLAANRAYLAAIPAKNINTKMLTDAETQGKLSHVNSQLENLLSTLKRLTKESGKKTELADFLGAPLASVSRWLSGEREPGGETTLQMLHWVEQQERQQNTPGSADNTAKGKTQIRKSCYEKTKPSPLKE